MKLVGVAKEEYLSLQNFSGAIPETSSSGISCTKDSPSTATAGQDYSMAKPSLSQVHHCDDPVLALLMPQSKSQSSVRTRYPSTSKCPEEIIHISPTAISESHKPILNIQATEFKPRQLNIQADVFIPNFNIK